MIQEEEEEEEEEVCLLVDFADEADQWVNKERKSES